MVNHSFDQVSAPCKVGVYLCMSSTLLASDVNFPNFEKSVWQ